MGQLIGQVDSASLCAIIITSECWNQTSPALWGAIRGVQVLALFRIPQRGSELAHHHSEW